MDLKLTQGMKKRILAILMILCIAITGIVSGVLFKVSVIDSKELSAMATDQQQSSFDIKAKRGTIYDRNNKVLAQSTTVWDVIISPGDIEKNEPENREFICKGISDILGVKYETLTEACKDTSSRYYVVKKKVDRSTVEKINNFVLKNNLNRYSVYTVENSERSYPNGTLGGKRSGICKRE